MITIDKQIEFVENEVADQECKWCGDHGKAILDTLRRVRDSGEGWTHFCTKVQERINVPFGAACHYCGRGE